MEAIKFIAAQVIAGQQYSATLLRVTLKAYRAEQAKKVETAKAERYEKITVRANGKCHPALFDNVTNTVTVVCNCPNSQNGVLTSRATKVADGYAKVNCRK